MTLAPCAATLSAVCRPPSAVRRPPSAVCRLPSRERTDGRRFDPRFSVYPAAPNRRSLWLAEALTGEPTAERAMPLSGTQRADVCVGGGGYSGNGVGPSHLAGNFLASAVLDRTDEWATTRLFNRAATPFPPEPVRFFGGIFVRAAVAAKEREEDQGREPNAVARRLAALAPSGMQKGAQPKQRAAIA